MTWQLLRMSQHVLSDLEREGARLYETWFARRIARWERVAIVTMQEVLLDLYRWYTVYRKRRASDRPAFF